MTDQILFDKLVYLDRLKGAGIPPEQARAHADALDAALRESVATKADIVLVRTDLREAVTRLETKIDLGIRDGTIRTGGMLVVAVGIVLGAIKILTH
jgi:hypothetical protein